LIPEGDAPDQALDRSRDEGASDAALVIARAMQRYGAVIGDQSGVPMALKLENLPVEGRSERWSDVGIDSDSLASIPFDDFECIQLGYHRPVARS
jgi:hypothetical protein